MHDDDILDRLHALGEHPVEPATAGAVLALAGRRPWWRTTKAKVAAGVAGAFLAGSMGLASAGTLPAPVQDAAHTTLGAVGVHVPPGHDRYAGPECGGATNHGQYVRAHHGEAGAAASPCGKPNRAVTPGAGGQQSGDQHQGPPPWAHGQGKGHAKGPKAGKGAGGDGEGSTTSAPVTTVPATVPPSTEPTTTTTTAATTTTSTASGSTPVQETTTTVP